MKKRNLEEEFKVPGSIKEQSNYLSWILKDLEETIAFGENFIKSFPDIKLLLLEGPLGAGKTSLVKGIAKGLDIQETITSPTFPLAQHYKKGQIPLIHIDLYRLDKPQLANELFLQEEEEASSSKALMVIEWPERLTLDLCEAWLAKIKPTNNARRVIQLIPPNSKDKNLSTSS
tara:strand:+ start:3321 stop:3842 length:522 start_codon:yes stop_codon:yes gene_type:complete